MRFIDRYNIVVPPEKLKDYLLNPNHPRGKHKARVFSGLGIVEEEHQLLERLIIKIAYENEIESEIEDQYGKSSLF